MSELNEQLVDDNITLASRLHSCMEKNKKLMDTLDWLYSFVNDKVVKELIEKTLKEVRK